MACFDSGQAHLVNTTPVKLLTFTDAAQGSIAFVSKTTAGSCYIGGSPTVSPTTGLQVPTGLPFSMPFKAGKGTSLYAVTDGSDVIISWMLGA